MRPERVPRRAPDAVLFEAVIGNDPSKCPRCRRVDGAAWTIAVALHVALLALAGSAEPSLETWSARLAAVIHEDLAAQAPVAIEAPPMVEPPAKEEPPPPPPEPPTRSEPAPVAEEPEPLVPEPAPAELPPLETEPDLEPAPPAEAGSVLAADPDPAAPVDFTDNTFVTGRASAYAGGATVRGGSRSGAGPDRVPQASEAGRGNAAATSQAQPVQLNGSEWRCDWPAAAMSQDIYEQFVVMRVVVNADGTVERAQAVNDPGFGFGAAATQCARRTRFTPARDDLGRPIRATSPPIRVRFTR